MIKMISAVTQAGCSANEDAWGAMARAAWVMDGATGLLKNRFLPGPSDAAWFVGHFGRALRSTTNWDEPVKSIIGNAADRVRARAESLGFIDDNPHAMPAASLAMARIGARGLDLICLGDCTILYSTDHGRTVMAHGRSAVTAFDEKIIRKIVRHQKRGPQSYDEIFERVKPEILKNRLRRNQNGGYWVLDMTRRPLRHLQSRGVGSKIRRGEPIRVAIMSDGFYRLVETFHVYDNRSLFAALFDRAPRDLLAELRNLESNDPDCRAFPRIKRRDDATALILEANG